MVTRTRLVLEIASELAGQSLLQAKVLLREPSGPWSTVLFGSSTTEGIDEVARGASHLAIVNPSAILTLAYRGVHPFQGRQPVRVIAVIPSFDQLVFAVRPETGLRCVEEIAERHLPLRISTRGIPDHCIHIMLDHVAEAAGFSFAAMTTWGGELRREGGLPTPGGAKFDAIKRGAIDAIFDEGADEWLEEALDLGLRILPLREASLGKLEAIGYRRARLPCHRYPKLPEDIVTLDFSGWPMLVHVDLNDDTVRQICAALVARKHLIPWQGEGPLPVERMCRNGPATPLDVPFHPAAERFWRDCGYL
jgi:TRAP-type uncharacterized transport system substrate-binding protein